MNPHKTETLGSQEPKRMPAWHALMPTLVMVALVIIAIVAGFTITWPKPTPADIQQSEDALRGAPPKP